ncbi:MAG: alpha/beta fold hydrolase [Halomonas subglaciescola]|nr:alpha/beta fold hydrolase [Halomonas subglaciescola]
MSTALRLTLLSGWGVDARIWQPLAPHWPEGASVTTPDWPGYSSPLVGSAPPLSNNMLASNTLAATANVMADRLPNDSVWVGWSLGGLLATALTEHLPAPRGLILLGAGARFCTPGGVTSDALADFIHAFERSPTAAWRHFLRWQTRGEPAPNAAFRALSTLLGSTPPADTATLRTGLGWLETLDNRARLAELACPVTQLAGEHDPLLGADQLTRSTLLDNAGHCPMVSKPAALAKALHRLATDMTTGPAEAP